LPPVGRFGPQPLGVYYARIRGNGKQFQNWQKAGARGVGE